MKDVIKMKNDERYPAAKVLTQEQSIDKNKRVEMNVCIDIKNNFIS